MNADRARRPDRAFSPLHLIGENIALLEPRYLAAVSLRRLLDPSLLSGVLVHDLQSQPAMMAQSLVSPDVGADAPGYLIAVEPGLFALSEGGQFTGPILSTDTSDGTENPIADGTGTRLPAGFSGQLSTQLTANNALEAVGTPDAGFTIEVTFDMTQMITQTTPITGGYWNFGATTWVGTGTTNGSGAPPDVTWNFVDTTKSSLPDWGSVPGNPSLYITGFFDLQHLPCSGTGGINPPSHSPPPLNGTGIDFVSTATGVTLIGPVTDPATENDDALRYTWPTVSGGVVTMNMQYYDGFFANDGTATLAVTKNFEMITSAAQENIAYEARLDTSFVTSSSGTQVCQSNMQLDFKEGVLAY